VYQQLGYRSRTVMPTVAWGMDSDTLQVVAAPGARVEVWGPPLARAAPAGQLADRQSFQTPVAPSTPGCRRLLRPSTRAPLTAASSLACAPAPAEADKSYLYAKEGVDAPEGATERASLIALTLGAKTQVTGSLLGDATLTDEEAAAAAAAARPKSTIDSGSYELARPNLLTRDSSQVLQGQEALVARAAGRQGGGGGGLSQGAAAGVAVGAVAGAAAAVAGAALFARRRGRAAQAGGGAAQHVGPAAPAGGSPLGVPPAATAAAAVAGGARGGEPGPLGECVEASLADWAGACAGGQPWRGDIEGGVVRGSGSRVGSGSGGVAHRGGAPAAAAGGKGRAGRSSLAGPR
jgi:hypothetical protein